ncbi:hypothetical protein WA1_06285 [Scytonema hofmannii PCC 7110]|uniref:DUF928 domain-containing protein n=1 Tax=Scytonema hofmannii PCC 7110 TaxID=128403 RepID=A0A139WSM3_9CYAN|nr:DUF928 domain-containing protein [Scytonema hofmannii]KYC35431.1 hypothetical protein WA1_06285 [Scytonema hofmannii PCC 7110]
MLDKEIKIRALTTIFLTSLLTCSFTLPQIVMAEAREGLPGRRVGGGTRSGCELNAKQLMALAPENNLGLTKAAYPTLFFYVPETSTPKTVEFILRDDKNRLVYEKSFTKTGSSGIINLSLPQAKSLPPLTIDKNYRWYLSMICEPKNRAKDIVVSGWIRRVQPDPIFMKKLEQTKTDAERADLYASAGLWQDALVTLAQPRYTQPNNSQLATSWTKLLQTEKLEAIAQEPLLSNR